MVLHSATTTCARPGGRPHSVGMRRKANISDALWQRAREQSGVLSHKQVSGEGHSRNEIQRFLDDRVLWQLARGLYGLAPDPPWAGLAWGGILLGGDGAALGGRSAGFLHGLCDQPETIDVLVPRRAKDRGCWRFHNVRAAATGTLRLAKVDEVVLQLCADATRGEVLGVLANAVSGRRTTVQRLQKAFEGRPKLRNRRLALDALRDVAEGVHSALEERFRGLLRSHWLPEPVRQGSVSKGTYSDNVYEDYMLVVELDGKLGHEGVEKWRDFRRDNRNAAAGWTTLRFGWWDVVERPCEVVAQLVHLLRSKGWRGDMLRCAACPTDDQPTPKQLQHVRQHPPHRLQRTGERANCHDISSAG